jgi:hypothetical protein
MSDHNKDNPLFEWGSELTKHFQEAASWISEKMYEQHDPQKLFDQIKSCNPFVMPGFMTDFFWNRPSSSENTEKE